MLKLPIPTIGRRVWYWPTAHEKSWNHDQPFDAGIVHVYSEKTVNLSVLNELGYPVTGKQSVERTTDDERKPGCWSWMPHQVPQAAPAQPAEQRLAGNNLPKTPPEVGGA